MAPRPQKEAEALARAGYQVEILGIWFDSELAARDEAIARGKAWSFRPVVDFRAAGLRRNFLRGRRKFADIAFRKAGVVMPALYSYAAPEMLRAARQARADLTIVHMEAGLWIGEKLLNDGRRVGVDFEDWFSEDLMESARRGRPIAELKRLEALLGKHCLYSLCTSEAMADAMAAEYGIPKPAVVYNVFPEEDTPAAGTDREKGETVSLHWFSQTIGEGRGLETLFAALPNVKAPLEIHLRGNLSPARKQWLDELIPEGFRSRVFTHATVPNQELAARIAQHDIGLAVETDAIRNRDVTITNKIFQYMQAGLAVIATDTRGQHEVWDRAGEIGRLIPCDNAAALARAIDELAQNRSLLEDCRRRAREACLTTFSWKRQEETILARVQEALSSKE